MLQAAPASARVWGWTWPGGAVTAFLNCSAVGVTATFNVTSDEDGLWVASFPPVPASLHVCVVSFTDVTSSTAVWYLDILFGTVLLCGGQSNQNLPLAYVENGTTSEAARANSYPSVRLLRIPLQAFSSGAASMPLREFAAIVPWAAANNVTTASFSAECWLTARGIADAAHRADPSIDGMPVGAIQSDWPGDSISQLSSAAALAQCGAAETRTDPAGVTFPGPIPGPHFPSSQYNAMIAPLTVGPLAISSFIYHQGEADVHTVASTDIYECRLRALIADWRATLGAWPGAFFGIAMLAPYSGDCGVGTSGCLVGVAAIRAAQLRVGLSTPNASTAVTTDAGDPQAPAGSVHSRRKQPVAARLVAGAAAVQWGAASKEGPVYGPLHARSIDASAAAGSLAADVAFVPESCEFGLQLVLNVNWTSTCPVGVSPTAPTLDECSWFSIQGAASGWHNATGVEVLNATAVRLSVPGVSDVAVATAFGQSAYPVTVLYSGDLPVAPWNATTALAAM